MRTYYPLDWIPRGATRAHFYLERAEGFREVIEAVLKVFNESQPIHDYSLGPVVFLLRHWIEIQLKGIYVYASEPASNEPVKSHEISSLYKIATEKIKEFASNRYLDRPRWNHKVEHILYLLGQYDPKGEVFRYPETLDGQSVFRKSMDSELYDVVMTVEGLTEFCTLIFDYLDGLEDWLDEMKENEEAASGEY